RGDLRHDPLPGLRHRPGHRVAPLRVVQHDGHHTIRRAVYGQEWIFARLRHGVSVAVRFGRRAAVGCSAFGAKSIYDLRYGTERQTMAEAYTGDAYCVKCKEKKNFTGEVKVSD